jgi:serine/threonine protein kinase
LHESEADIVREYACLLLGEEGKGKERLQMLEQLECDLNEQVTTCYDDERKKELGGVITLASEFNEKMEVVEIMKGEVAYGDDSFSTVIHVKEFENVSGGAVSAKDVVLKILDSSRFRLDLNSSFFVSNVDLAKIDGVKMPLDDDYTVQMNTINNIKLAIHNYFNELEAYLLIKESCPETWRLFLPNLIEFGVYLSNIADIHESRTIFAEGLFFKFSYIEEVDAHSLDTQSKAIVVAEAFSHLQQIHTSGVSHRDLRAPNVLVNKRDDGNFGIVFIDFGSSIQIKTHLRRLSLKPQINDFSDLSIGNSLSNSSGVLLEKFPHIEESLRDDFSQDYLGLRAALIKKGIDVDIMEMNPDNIPMFVERDLSTLKNNG